MYKFGDSFPVTQNTNKDWLSTSNTSIKVLVIDFKKDLLSYVAEMLNSCSFEVTCADSSGAGLRLLSEKKNHFDLILIDSDMSDVDTHTFLRLTKNMDVLAVVMSEQENDAFILEVFKSGAFLVVKRPLTMDAVRRMRQDVIRKRMRTHEKCGNKDVIIKNERQETDMQETRSSGSGKNGGCELKKRVHQLSDDDDNDDYNDEISMKKKICVEWTEELHEKFVNAVRQLGEGRCFPKKILDLMAVPGLTRMQVASHLQKCRKEKMNFNYDKKPTQNNGLSSNLFTQGVDERRFGCMPSLQTNAKNHEESNTLIGINLSINGWQTEVNHMKNQNYRGSSSMLNISNQKNIAQRIEYTQIPFGSDLVLNHDDRFGSRIIKATNNYFQQTISGLRDAGQGSNDQNLPLIRRHVSEEFPDFLKDLDGNGPNDI